MGFEIYQISMGYECRGIHVFMYWELTGSTITPGKEKNCNLTFTKYLTMQKYLSNVAMKMNHRLLGKENDV